MSEMKPRAMVNVEPVREIGSITSKLMGLQHLVSDLEGARNVFHTTMERTLKPFPKAVVNNEVAAGHRIPETLEEHVDVLSDRIFSVLQDLQHIAGKLDEAI